MSGNSHGQIVLIFESDWHVGTGTGIPGSTDKLIFRDADGFPAVPAKTLNGIWRDAMETLTLGLDDGDENNKRWQKWVVAIFGNQPAEKGADPTITPFQSILTLRPARISEDLRAAIGTDEDGKKFKQALTFIKAGIEIDNQSGTAKENHLRFEEMGRCGTILEAAFDARTDNETAQALLALSGELIERIGGKRRRGAGKCKFVVKGLMTKDKAIEHLQTFADKDAPEVPAVNKTSNDIDLEKANDSTEWRTLEYRLTLQTPVSIVTAVLGNVSESLDFIPGTYLLPHVTNGLNKKEVRSAVANGDFQVSFATVEIDKKRGFPIPKVFAKEKMKQKERDKEEIYNRLLEPLEEKFQTKPIREGFISEINSNTLSIAETPQTLLIHNTVDDKFQRPTENVGGVFSREAIKAGTVLLGEIRWKKYLNLKDEDFGKPKESVRLGTSKKDDYGLADFEIVGKSESFEAQSAANSKPQGLVVYLASDILLRNDNLRQTNLVEDLAKKLGDKLGVKLTEAKPETGLISSIIQVRRIESWQVSWGFPRPTLTTMAAGSVVVFETENKIDLTKVKEIEANGIGERRGEGYGQVVFNPPILKVSKPAWQKGKLTEAEKSKDAGKLDDDFSRQIELTAWREELKVAVLKIAANEDCREKIFGFEIKVENGEKKSIPPMSQIGGLRSVISRLQNKSSVELVKSWLEHLEKTSNRLEKWHKDKNKAIEKLQKIKNLVGEKSEIWRVLREAKIDEKTTWQKLKSITRQNLEEDENLWAEAIRALFFACQHAHKRDLEKMEWKKEAANG
ncbi:MAG: RAMP superfamily CRISPR-associated protein [Pyrinomonadaceae bacterium]